MNDLEEAIKYLSDIAECMEGEGLDRENNARHYRIVCNSALRVKGLEEVLYLALEAFHQLDDEDEQQITVINAIELSLRPHQGETK